MVSSDLQYYVHFLVALVKNHLQIYWLLFLVISINSKVRGKFVYAE